MAFSNINCYQPTVNKDNFKQGYYILAVVVYLQGFNL